jgi:hypothetical protein
MIVEYDSSMPQEVMMWQRIIASSGGEVETVYGPRVTHVLCETQKSATFQRVTNAMNLLSFALYYFYALYCDMASDWCQKWGRIG